MKSGPSAWEKLKLWTTFNISPSVILASINIQLLTSFWIGNAE